MSINKLKAEKIIVVNDVEYKARMPIDTIMRIETALNCGLLKLAQRLTEADITLSEVVQFLTLALRGGGNDIKEKEVKALVNSMGLVEAFKVTGEIIALALDTNEEEKEKKNQE